MVLFGENTSYISHMPVFHAPHATQAVFAVTLAESMDPRQPPGETLAQYTSAKNAGQTLFTIVSDPIDLDQLVARRISVFQADLYSGHFERGGSLLGRVQITVEETVFSRPISPTDATNGYETYTAFGLDDEYYAIHWIGGDQRYDRIVKVSHLQESLGEPGPCRLRYCPSRSIPIPDDHLPIALTHDGWGGLNAGFIYGAITEILHQEDIDLQP
jgi:hypothetical protein